LDNKKEKVIQKGDKKIVKAWVFYDWANSVYNLVITAAIFPIYYTTLAENTGGIVRFLGRDFPSESFYNYVLALSFLVVSFSSPLLSGIADYSGNKKRFLQFFCYLGAISCIGIFFFDINHIGLSMIPVFFASIGFWSSLVFYNAYLPEIAEPKDHDKISARGFSMGYIGSSILLIICLTIIMAIDPSYTKYSFLLVGIWWIGFSQVTFRKLPNNVYGRTAGGNPFTKGYQELSKVWDELKENKLLKRFLLAFFVFNMGVQTIMINASIYGSKEVGVDSQGLIIAILLIQFVGALGSHLMSFISSKIGNIYTLFIIVFMWVIICVVAYYTYTNVVFYVLAAFVGLVMGGIQALSRSTYAKLLPETKDHASYFSFYDVLEKLGLTIGLFLFGFISEFTGSMRNSILMLVTLFIIGLFLLWLNPLKGEITEEKKASI